MRNVTRAWLLALIGTAGLDLPTLADAPHIYALSNTRIVTVAGDPIARGTVVMRGGLIESVGEAAAPADAYVIDGEGLTVYPGLIDMGNRAASPAVDSQPPPNPESREETERWKRTVLLHPEHLAARRVRVDAPELTRLASAGITTVLAVPGGELFKGQSALVNVVAPDDAPQIGSLADERLGQIVVKSPVGLHIAIPARARGNAYPASLMGMVAFVRQAFLDAQHYRQGHSQYQRSKTGIRRPAFDESLEALHPALDGRLPVVFEAQSEREIRRALAMAREFGLSPIIEGGHEADRVAVQLQQNAARVVFSLDYPTRPRTLAPDADEPIRELRLRARVPKVPGELHRAGVPMAFASAGLRDPKDFLKNAAKAVAAGLPPEAAVRALTLQAAVIAGVGERLGSIEPGKFANLIVTDGDLFEDKTTIKHVFIDGRPVPLTGL